MSTGPDLFLRLSSRIIRTIRGKVFKQRARAIASIIESLEERQLYSSYYVNASAGSGGSGSAASPWNSLSSVSNYTGFNSGDTVYLTGTFNNQTLTLGNHATGITVTSNVSSPATIQEAASYSFNDGIYVTTGGVTLSGITLIGPGLTNSTNNNFFGILFDDTSSSSLNGATVYNCSASGFAFGGIELAGNSTFGFNSASISYSTFSGNQVSGIQVKSVTSGAPTYAFYNLSISHCVTSNNAGDALYWNAHNSGQSQNSSNGGIYLDSVGSGQVDHCTADGNCYNSTGAVGIWAYDSTSLIFSNDESTDTVTDVVGSTKDGDGFDFDHGVSNSIMEYCYSHGNYGSGFELCSFAGTSGYDDSNDTIRDCISDDDDLCGIDIYSVSGPYVTNADVYNNTILTKPNVVGGFHYQDNAVLVSGPGASSTSVNFLNNIFFGTGYNSASAIISVTASNDLKFEGNDYWSSGGSTNFQVSWDSTNYSSLTSWVSPSGEETISSSTVGLNLDPALVNETVSDLPISQISNLELSLTSPMRNAGQNLTAAPYSNTAPYDNNPPYNVGGTKWSGLGSQDYFGQPVSNGIGADQSTVITLMGSAGGDTFALKEDASMPHTMDVNTTKYNLSGVVGVSINGSTGNEFVSFNYVNGPLENSSPTAPILPFGLTFNSGSASGNTFAITNTGTGASNTMPVNIDANSSGIVTIPVGTGTGINVETFSNIVITAGSELTVATPSNHAAKSLIVVTGTLALAGSTNSWTGKLDLGGNDMDVKNGNIATLTNQTKGGYNSGAWNGNGIASTAAANDTRHQTALGVIQNSVDGTTSGTALYGSGAALGLFDGVSTANTDVLIKYTWAGDANLSGVVDGTDFSRTDNGYDNGATGWYNGDYNYDGVVDGSDYTIIDNVSNAYPGGTPQM